MGTQISWIYFKKEEPGKIVVHENRVKRLKDKRRGLTKKMRGNNLTDSTRKLIMPITRGWANYFGLAEERGIFGSLDGWIRRKIRGMRQWKKPKAQLKKLIALGIRESTAKSLAYSSKGSWRIARSYGMHKGLANKVIESMGYIPMMNLVRARSQ